MTDNPVILELDDRGVAWLTLNRPSIHNAFDDQLIERLLQALEAVEADPGARLLVLRAEGRSFSAGADLNWMRRMADYAEAENLADARQLAALMSSLNNLGIPSIAQVQGAAFGGGVGLVACCDIAVASEQARFCLSEVRLGLVPAVISPYVIAAIGERAARRYFQTAERFDAEEARRIGLVHEVVGPERLGETVEGLIDSLLLGGPRALGAAKRLIFDVAHRPLDAALIEQTAQTITRIRASEEGREGLGAFLEKRSPEWVKG